MPLASLPELCYNVRERKNKRLRSRHLFFAAITNEPPASAGKKRVALVREFFSSILLQSRLWPLANEPSAIADNERDSAGSRAVAGIRLRQQTMSATVRVRKRSRREHARR